MLPEVAARVEDLALGVGRVAAVFSDRQDAVHRQLAAHLARRRVVAQRGLDGVHQLDPELAGHQQAHRQRVARRGLLRREAGVCDVGVVACRQWERSVMEESPRRVGSHR